jgi:hypothetical protein
LSADASLPQYESSRFFRNVDKYHITRYYITKYRSFLYSHQSQNLNSRTKNT